MAFLLSWKLRLKTRKGFDDDLASGRVFLISADTAGTSSVVLKADLIIQSPPSAFSCTSPLADAQLELRFLISCRLHRYLPPLLTRVRNRIRD